MLSGRPDEEIRRLKGRPGSDIVCTGSITLVHELIEAGLVDEVPPLRAPGRAGIGRRLFEPGRRSRTSSW